MARSDKCKPIDHWLLARHEAGHAVMAWILKVPIIQVSLMPGELEERGDGFYVTLGHCAYKSRVYRRQEENPTFRAAQEKDAMISMAGSIAEGIAKGIAVRPGRIEAKQIKSLTKNHHGGYTWVSLGDPDENNEMREDVRKKHLSWLRARALVHLQDAWPLVEALAGALMERETLNGKEVRRILRETSKRLHDEMRV
jgi:ATP-dependent Zn protease